MATTDVSSVLSRLDAVKDAINVQRAFGEPYQIDGVTVIPVAKVGGGGGAGGGEGSQPGQQEQQASGAGAGMGFGVGVKPLGVYTVKDGQVTWQPAVDIMRIVLGGQLLMLAALFVLRSILRRRT